MPSSKKSKLAETDDSVSLGRSSNNFSLNEVFKMN